MAGAGNGRVRAGAARTEGQVGGAGFPRAAPNKQPGGHAAEQGSEDGPPRAAAVHGPGEVIKALCVHGGYLQGRARELTAQGGPIEEHPRGRTLQKPFGGRAGTGSRP